MKKIVILLSILIAFTSSANEKNVSIGEFELAYEIGGQGKQTILLEAGMGQGLSTWGPLYNDLTKLARVVRYSRVGLENSTQIKRQFTVNDYANHLVLLLNALNIQSPVILMAHSFGGPISRTFAANYPDKVKALLLVDPSSEADLDIMRQINLSQATKEIAFMKTMGIEDGLDNSFLEYWSKRTMPNYPEIKDIPVVVIATIKKFSNPPMLLLTDEGRKIMGEWHVNWAESFPQGKAVLTSKSYHHIHRDEPELVLKEVKLLLSTLL